MRAGARIGVERRGGRDVVVHRDAEAPLTVRRCAQRVLIAASAASPVGGDELTVDVDLGRGAVADIGTVAATMVWPGPGGRWSSMSTTCDVAEGAALTWWPEPTISVVGSKHRSTMVVRLGREATCTIVEEIALGRTDERSGIVELDLRVERDGPLVHHRERFGAGASSVSVGSARHVVSAVVVGAAAGDSRTALSRSSAAAWLPVAADAVMVMAVGPDRPSVWTLLATLAPELGRHRPNAVW